MVFLTQQYLNLLVRLLLLTRERLLCLIWIFLLSFLQRMHRAKETLAKNKASERLVQQLRAEDLAQEDLPNVSEERAKELDDLMMRMTETDWLNLMMQVGSNPALARELLGADVTEENFIERMTAVKEWKKRALADLRYRALKGKPLKKSEVTQLMRNLVKNQWVERASSQPASVPAATTHTADDPDSAGGGSSNPAGSAFGAPVTDPTVSTSAAMDSAGSHREIGVSPFADSATSSSLSNVSTDHIPIDVLFASTSGGIHDFFLESDEEEQIGLSRVAADPDSDDEVLAEIIFRGKSILGDGVVLVDKLPDDEIVDPRVKVETVSDYASSPPRIRRKHLWGEDDECPMGYTCAKVYFTYLNSCSQLHVYREDILLLRRRMNRYFWLNPEVNIGLDLWRDVNMLCQSLHSNDVEDFWRTQDEWIVSSWKLYPKSSVHVLDLTNGKTMYMFMDKSYPIRATLLERMLRHRLTVPPSYCRDVVVAGNIIQTVQTGLRQSYECLASAPIQERRLAHHCKRLLVCNSNPVDSCYPKLDGYHFPYSLDEKWLVHSKRLMEELLIPEQTATVKDVSNPYWKLLFFDSAVSIDAADLDAASTVFAACIVSAGICFCCYSILLLREDLSRNLELTESTPSLGEDFISADYVSAGHVLVSADRDRICWSSYGAENVTHWVIRKKKWGMRMNEGLWVLFIESKELFRGFCNFPYSTIPLRTAAVPECA
ncbi:hypothetical protein Tco_0925342 [Tanacetum coccineum]|uniref:Uncharacterized protein n=1 Tax=Tanacetum coccineum TaxID=301880 RepID=A0ABQ5D8L4_9ASTR